MEAQRQDFERIFQDHLSEVQRLIALHTKDPEEKMDLTQEVFIRAYSAFSQFRGDSSVSTWLYRIAVNVCANASRFRSRHPEDSNSDIEMFNCPDGLRDIVEELATAEERRMLKKALRSLSAQQLLVLSLRFSDQLTLPEIAEVVGSPVDTVKSRLRGALDKVHSSMNFMSLSGVASCRDHLLNDDEEMSLEDVRLEGESGARIYHSLGSLYLRKGLIEAALTEWRRAQSVDPTFIDSYVASAQEYVKMNDPLKAVDVLETAAGKIQNSGLHTRLAHVYLDVGDLDKGLVHSVRAVDLQPDSPDAHYSAGRAFYNQAQMLEALRSLSSGNNNGEPTVEASWRKSAMHFKEAIHLCPDFGKARSFLAITYLLNKQTDKAITESQEALKVSGQDDLVPHQVGWVHYRIGKLTLAERYLRQSLVLRKTGDKLGLLGEIYIAQERNEEAYIALNEALSLTVDKRTRARMYSNHASIALKLGKIADAIESAEEAIKLDSSQIHARCNLAEAHLRHGDNPDFVIGLCQEGLRLAPDHTCFHHLIAEAYFHKERLEEAYIEATTAIEIAPGNSARWILRSRILTHMERFDEAKKDLVSAIELDLHNQDARHALNEIEENKKSTDTV